ncbi:MAG: copper resistance protein CopC/CopD [Acidimicrobiales bacterium]|nr:copper resistance protein CopC/CopD [Acidimicrobiales bacterium]
MSKSGAPAFPRAACLTLLACAAALIAFIGPMAAPVSAHATLVSTTPPGDELIDRVPADVQLVFDEAVEVVDGGVRVFGPSGERVDRGLAETRDGGRTVLAAIDDPGIQGTYTVSWRVLSEDSHNLSGSFVFHVGTETGAADIGDDADTVTDLAGGIGRWVSYAGALVALGAAVLAFANPGEPTVRRRLRLIVMIGAGAAAVATMVVLVAQTADVSGRSLLDSVGLTVDIAMDTRSGRLAVLRLFFLVAAGGAASIGALWSKRPWIAGGLVAAAMVTWPLSGHAWTTSPRWAAVVVDLVHLVAVGVWVGGLFALGCTLRAAGDQAAMARRFSKVALVTVVAVAISGSLSAFWQLRSFDALLDTGFGQLLTAKIAGFAALVILGSLNRSLVASWADRSAALLVRFVKAEVVVAIVVLALTAAMVNQPPGRESVGGPFEISTQAVGGGGRLDLTVTPARVGQNDIHLYFFDEAGQGLVPVDAVEVTAGTDQINPRRLDIEAVTPSHFSSYGASLTAPGTWTLTVTAVQQGQTSNYTIEVPVR